MLLVTGLLLSTGRDERELLAEELRDAPARRRSTRPSLLDTIINSMAEGLAVVDDAGEILMLNPAAPAVLGFAEPTGHAT